MDGRSAKTPRMLLPGDMVAGGDENDPVDDGD
jgi:hypothetical protein